MQESESVNVGEVLAMIEEVLAMLEEVLAIGKTGV